MSGRGVSRRGLIGGGAGLAAAAALGAGTRAVGAGEADAAAAAARCSLLPPERIGVMLYSVRDAIAEQGFAPVLEELAKIGYEQIEFAGYTDSTGISLEGLRELLDANGLKAAGSHVSPSDASMEQLLDEAETLGIPNIGISLILPDGPPTVAGWAAQAENFNRFGEAAAKRGIGFYMHNHFEEWFPCMDDPSKRGMDVLLAETDPDKVDWQCDVYWIHVGQAQSGLTPFDPLTDYIIPHRKRIKLFHFKDGRPSDPPIAGITDVGEGAIEFQRIFTELFKQSRNEDKKYVYLWERDNASDHPRGSMAAAISSFVNMRHGLYGDNACAPAGAAKFRATIASTAWRGRRLRVKLKLSKAATVTAKLTRGNKTLAGSSEVLGKGTRSFDLRVPAKVGPGPAKLKLIVSDGAGVTLTLRDVVRIP